MEKEKELSDDNNRLWYHLCVVRLQHTCQNISVFHLSQMSFTITTSGSCAAASTKHRFVLFFSPLVHHETKMSLKRDIFMMLTSEGLRSSRFAALRFHRCRTYSPQPKCLMNYTAVGASLALYWRVQESLLCGGVNRPGQIRMVHFCFECKNLTPLPKAGKYFCTFTTKLSRWKEGILFVWFDSLHSVLGVGRKGCWRSEATELAKDAKMALKIQNGNMLSFGIVSVSPDFTGFKEMLLEISNLFSS